MSNAAALFRLSNSLHGVSSIEALLDRVRTALMENTRYRHVYVHLLNPDGKTFEIVGYVVPEKNLLRQQLRLIDVSKDRLIQMANAATEPFFIEDLRLHPYADQKQVEFWGNRTSICIPMFEADSQIGPLIVATYGDEGVKPPTTEELDFLIQVGSLVAVVVGRLRAEQARQTVENRLAQTERLESLGRLAGEVSHDFNNLLVSILTNVDLAIDEVKGLPTKELLEDVREAAQRASRLTRQLLAFARGQVLQKRPVALAQLLDGLSRLLEPMMSNGVKLAVRGGAELGVLMADADQLERALMNLAVNARDAIGLKPGTVTIEAERVDLREETIAGQHDVAPGSYVVFSVSDDGAGMDEATRARIFEPFFTTKGVDRGTGLGMSVVDGVVKQHGGSIHVYSELGQGTTFKLFIPAEVVGVFDTPAPVIARSTGTERVLVVDDDERVRRSIERVLRRAGFSVLVAAAAEPALEAVASEAIDVVLTDIMLPGLDGVAFSKRVAELKPGLPVRFMTGYARGRVGSLATPHLSKPFATADLLRLITEAIDRK